MHHQHAGRLTAYPVPRQAEMLARFGATGPCMACAGFFWVLPAGAVAHKLLGVFCLVCLFLVFTLRQHQLHVCTSVLWFLFCFIFFLVACLYVHVAPAGAPA